MPDLVDLEAPVALWVVVASVLEDAGVDGLSVGAIARAVDERSGGRHRRRASVGGALARLVELQLVAMERRPVPGRNMPEHAHRLTARGTALLERTRADLRRALNLHDGDDADGP